MANERDSKRYEAILFDVGDTLLTKNPADFQVFAERYQEAGIVLDMERAKIGWKNSELWIKQQILKEMAGEPRVPDHEFFRWSDSIALQTAFGEKLYEDIWEMVSLLLPLQGQRQSWDVIAGKFHKSP